MQRLAILGFAFTTTDSRESELKDRSSLASKESCWRCFKFSLWRNLQSENHHWCEFESQESLTLGFTTMVSNFQTLTFLPIQKPKPFHYRSPIISRFSLEIFLIFLEYFLGWLHSFWGWKFKIIEMFFDTGQRKMLFRQFKNTHFCNAWNLIWEATIMKFSTRIRKIGKGITHKKEFHLIFAPQK